MTIQVLNTPADREYFDGELWRAVDVNEIQGKILGLQSTFERKWIFHRTRFNVDGLKRGTKTNGTEWYAFGTADNDNLDDTAFIAEFVTTSDISMVAWRSEWKGASHGGIDGSTSVHTNRVRERWDGDAGTRTGWTIRNKQNYRWNSQNAFDVAIDANFDGEPEGTGKQLSPWNFLFITPGEWRLQPVVEEGARPFERFSSAQDRYKGGLKKRITGYDGMMFEFILVGTVTTAPRPVPVFSGSLEIS